MTPVSIDSLTLWKAENLIDSCEACTPDQAEIPFDSVLDFVTGCDPKLTDYVLAESARCPRCAGTLESGYWRWCTPEQEGYMVVVFPGTLVTLKDE